MPRACTVCTHAEREAIDRALVAGRSLRELSALFRETSEDAMGRHRDGHLPAKLADAKQAQDEAHADDLLAQLRGLRSKAVQLLLKAEQQGDIRTALAGIREARGCLELLAEMEGELDRRAVVNVTLSAEWLLVRETIFTALEPHPEARTAVVARLVALEGTSNGHAR